MPTLVFEVDRKPTYGKFSTSFRISEHTGRAIRIRHPFQQIDRYKFDQLGVNGHKLVRHIARVDGVTQVTVHNAYQLTIQITPAIPMAEICKKVIEIYRQVFDLNSNLEINYINFDPSE